MDDQIEPADAARALSEIGRRREQVIRQAAVPGWYWWASGVLSIELSAAVDFQRGVLSWIGTALFITGMLAVNGLALSRQHRRGGLHPDLVAPGYGPRLWGGQAALAAAMTGVCLGTGLGLEAARVPYPATIATAAATVVFVAGGLAMTRYHTDFLVRRSGGRG